MAKTKNMLTKIRRNKSEQAQWIIAYNEHICNFWMKCIKTARRDCCFKLHLVVDIFIIVIGQ